MGIVIHRESEYNIQGATYVVSTTVLSMRPVPIRGAATRYYQGYNRATTQAGNKAGYKRRVGSDSAETGSEYEAPVTL